MQLMQLISLFKKGQSKLRAKILAKKTKRFLSVDFGRAFVKLAYLECRGENFKLLSYDIKKIFGSDEDSRREVVEFIQNFLKVNAAGETEVYLTLAQSETVIIKSLTLPVMPKAEIVRAAKWELKDEVGFNLEEALVDWQVVKEFTDEEGAEKNEIIFIFAETETINKYLAIINECRLLPVWISCGPFNYSHLLRHSQANLAVLSLLDIGYQDSTLCIYKNNKLIFVRKLNFSADRLTQSLTASLVSDEGKLNLSYDEAEKIKNTFGIPQAEGGLLENNIQPMQIISLMRPLLEELIRELRHSFDFFTANLQEQAPSLLYITGGGAGLKNLEPYLHNQLNIEVVRLDFPDCIDTKHLEREKLTSDKSQIINALGAVLAGRRAINLLPAEIKTRKIELIEKVSLRLVAVTVWAIFLFSWLILNLQINDYKNRLKNAQVHLQTISGIKVLKHKVDLRENLIKRIQYGRIPVEGLLKLISAIIPNSVILEELIFDTKTHSLILKGQVLAAEDISGSVLTGFMEKIEASAFFTEARLVTSKKLGQAQWFEIKCDLIY